MTGTPACRSAVAWSVMAMVLDGLSAFTRGLMVVSTASARTVTILALDFCDSLALWNDREPVPAEVFAGMLKDGVEVEEEAEREEKEAIGAPAAALARWLVARF